MTYDDIYKFTNGRWVAAGKMENTRQFHAVSSVNRNELIDANLD